jgi:hypothetical protein
MIWLGQKELLKNYYMISLFYNHNMYLFFFIKFHNKYKILNILIINI